MSISEKIKTVNNKIEQNNAQYNLDRQTSKISALSSGNVNKYEFLATSKDVLTKKELLGKAATVKRVEYYPLGKELKTQTDISNKQYQGLNKFLKSKEKEKKKQHLKSIINHI